MTCWPWSIISDCFGADQILAPLPGRLLRVFKNRFKFSGFQNPPCTNFTTFVKSFCKNINHIKKFINTFPKVLTTPKKSKTTKQTVKLNYFVFFKITTWNSWFKVSSDIKLRTEEETYLLTPASLRVILKGRFWLTNQFQKYFPNFFTHT